MRYLNFRPIGVFFLLLCSPLSDGSAAPIPPAAGEPGQDVESNSRQDEPTGKPNILFFLVDDMGWQDTSVPFHTEATQLNRDYRTPNLERLASQSLLFTNAYACSICSPTRVSLMTGQNAARHGVTCWTLRKDTSPERPNEKFAPVDWPLNGLQPAGTELPKSFASHTLPERLSAAGYRAIHAGKGHFGAKDTPGANPKNLGFDVNIAGSYMGGPGSYYGDKNFSAVWRGGDRIWDIPGLEKYHGQTINLMEAITREAIAAVEQSVADKKPFYLYMSQYGVHAPFEPDRRFLSDYENQDWNKHKKTYASMLAGMDRSLGDLLATLDRLEIAENTVVVFMSDNGSPGVNPPNLPLRGCKISGYEGGTRVPMLVRWPGRTSGNTRTDAPIIIEDLYPTILAMAGLKPKHDIDGVSFADIVDQPNTDRSQRPLFWHYPNFYHLPPYSSVRQGNLKLIYWHANQRLELFDLETDIGEARDLSSERPEDVRRLARLLGNYLRQAGALMPTIRETGEPIPWPDKVSAK